MILSIRLNKIFCLSMKDFFRCWKYRLLIVNHNFLCFLFSNNNLYNFTFIFYTLSQILFFLKNVSICYSILLLFYSFIRINLKRLKSKPCISNLLLFEFSNILFLIYHVIFFTIILIFFGVQFNIYSCFVF